jgi:hypothetical protein
MHTVFWLENLKGGDHAEYLGIEKQDGKVWAGLFWLRIGTRGGLL